MRKRLASLWSLLRTLTSDDAYERYYLGEQERKWMGVSRCC
jgi:hypothetical protein